MMVVAAEPAQSLVVVGPTQSGKTTSSGRPGDPGVAGPVVAASVKSDLLRDTRRRRRAGPGLVHRPDRVPPGAGRAMVAAHGCGHWRGARRVAAELAEAAKADGTTADGEFWYATAAKLLAPLFLAAALGGRTMADVVRWVDTQEVGEVSDILEPAGVPEALMRRGRPGAATNGPAVRSTPRPKRFWHPLPPRRLAAARAARSNRLNCSAARHTLYLCAPAHDQRRLRGYFTALTRR